MSRLSRTCLLVAMIAFCGLTELGCGTNTKAMPKGHVVNNGQPYKLADGEQMNITFVSTGKAGSASATVSSDGSFTVSDPGLSPGSYNVSIISTMVGPNVPAKDQYKDKFKGAFEGPKTPLNVEIGTGNPTIEIDVEKKTVTAK